LDINKKLADANPQNTYFAAELGLSLMNLAILFARTERSDDALKTYEETIKVLQGVLHKNARHAEARLYLRSVHWGRAGPGRAELLGNLARHKEAVKDWERAITLDSGAQRSHFVVLRAGSLARSGDHAAASAVAAKLEKLPGETGENLYNSACIYALSSAAAGRDTKLAAAVRKKLASQYGARAVELLGKAGAAGYFKNPAQIVHMKKDTDLEPLRNRTDFKKFLAEIEKKDESPAK